MSETRGNVGFGALALIPIVCCVGIPLIAAAGMSVAVAAWVGGIAVAAAVLVAVGILLTLRVRRRRGQPTQPLSLTRDRS